MFFFGVCFYIGLNLYAICRCCLFIQDVSYIVDFCALGNNAAWIIIHQTDISETSDRLKGPMRYNL